MSHRGNLQYETISYFCHGNVHVACVAVATHLSGLNGPTIPVGWPSDSRRLNGRSSVVVRRGAVLFATGIAVVGMAVFVYGRQQTPTGGGQREGRSNTYTVARRDFVRAVRLNGTVEAVQSTTIAAPRLAGPTSNSLIITRLVRPGSTVRPGDLIVEFDRQDQIKNALDRRAELQDLEQQIAKREAQERAARAHDDSEITLAESAIGRAQLEMGKNELLPKINAEKNKLALEQAEATLKQLKATYELKRRAAEADIRILQIRRDRAANAERQAAGNAERMSIHAPIGGMAVVKTIWKGNNMADVQEGEEVRAGVPVVDIVNPNAMRVRARVNQADVNELQVGQAVRIGLDAYPDAVLRRPGRADFPARRARRRSRRRCATSSSSSTCNGSHPNLMPDLSASLDVTLARTPRRHRRAARRASHGRRSHLRPRAARRRLRGSRGHRRAPSTRTKRCSGQASMRAPSSRGTCCRTAGRSRVMAAAPIRPASAQHRRRRSSIVGVARRRRVRRRAAQRRAPDLPTAGRDAEASSSTRSRFAARSGRSNRSCCLRQCSRANCRSSSSRRAGRW